MQDAVQAKEPERFARAYRQMMDSCYACHVAASKPHLRLQIPKEPEAPIINFDPAP